MYDARRTAVKELLEATAESSEKVFKKSHDVKLEEKVGDHFERYFNDRKRALEDGVKLLASPKPPKDHQDDWSDHFSDFGSKSAKAIAALVKDSKIKTPFVSAVSRLAAEESNFFAAIARMPMAASQGRILQWYGQYMREEKALRDSWSSIQDDGSDLMKDMVEAMEDANEVFEQAVEKAAKKVRDAEAALLRWVPVFEQGEDLSDYKEPGPVDSALSMLGYALQALNNLRPSAETLAGRFRGLYKSHEVVTIQLFGKTREKVEDFIDTVNLETAVKDFETASKACVSLAQGLDPDGQEDDAEDLVEAMIDEAHETLEQFEDFFEEFVDDFRGIFLGPVGDRTVQDLVGRQLAQRQSDQFQRLNIQSELKKIQQAADDEFDLPMGRLSDEKRKQLKKWITRDLETLSLAVREAIDFTLSERIQMMMRLAIPEREEKVKRLPGASV